MTKFLRNNEESGRSMVEMLGVLAIVGVLSIGGIAGYSKAMAKYKLNKTLDQVSMIITNVRTTFGNQYSYAGLDNNTAVTYDIAGNDLSHGTSNTLTNAFSGSVTISAASKSDGTGCTITGSADATYCPYFKITYTKVPTQACTEIAMSDWGGSAASGLYSITINTETAHTWGGTSALPISLVSADSECSKSAENTITWIYN